MKSSLVLAPLIRNDFTCFYSKRTVDEDIIGYGVALEHYPPRTGDEQPRLAYVHASLEYLSLTSFGQEKVRQTAFKESFSHWVPLVIDSEHWTKSRVIAKECIAMMYDSLWKSRRNPLEFKPEMVLEVLPKILNTLVVGVMGGDLYASIAALEGYMAFSHLLLTFAHDEPKIRTLIDERIQLFLTSEQGRSKSACPSLGDLIAMMIDLVSQS